MADTGDDGQRKLRTGRSEQIGIESAQVAYRTAATDDDHHIKCLHPGHDGIQRLHDALLHLLPLHHGGEEFAAEVVAAAVVLQLVHEVAIAGCCGRGDDGNTLRQLGHGELLVEVNHPLLLQLTQDKLTLTHHIADGVGGVDVLNNEGVAIELVKLDGDEHLHPQTGGKGTTGDLLEIEGQEAIDVTPDGAACLGQQGAACLVALNKLHVAVAGAVHAHLAQFGLHPVGVAQLALHREAHQAVEGKE